MNTRTFTITTRSSIFAVFLVTHVCFSQSIEQSVAPASVIIELLALNKDIATPIKPKYLSPTALVASPDSQYLYVAEQTAKQIAIVDIASNSVKATIKLPNEVTGIAVAPDGLKLYATCSSDLSPSGMVCEVNVASRFVTRRLPAGQGARSPVISHDGKTLYVCNWHENTVYVDDITTGQCVTAIPVLREPFAAAITPDDSTLIVTNSLPVEKAIDTANFTSKLLLVDTHVGKVTDTIPLPIGSNSVLGVAVSPDGKYAFATHLIAWFALPTTRVDGGWIHTNNCAIVDIKNRKILNDAPLDAPLMGAGNPWGIACSQDGKYVCVAHSGSNELSVIDLKRFISVAETSDYYPNIMFFPANRPSLSHNLAALEDFSDKISVLGKCPRALTIVGNKTITAGYFDDFLEVYELALPGSGTKTTRIKKIDLGSEVPKTAERMGEIAFYDASLCIQSWQSCHSCHPFGRADGINWDLRGPLVAPKNGKSLVYSWWTPPMNWTGSRPNAHESDMAAMTNELFLVADPTIVLNIDTFLMKLKPVPSPHLVKGSLSETAKKGRTMFMTNPGLDCKDCHPAPLFTNLKFKNAYIIDPYDANKDWDTPSLIEAWRTAPYDHLGSFDQMSDILQFKGMSNASNLPQQDFNALLEYVLSL